MSERKDAANANVRPDKKCGTRVEQGPDVDISAAAEKLFGDIAGMLYRARETMRSMDDGDPVAWADVHATISAAGALADEGSVALGGGRMLDNLFEWLASPQTIEALKSIESRSDPLRRTGRVPPGR